MEVNDDAIALKGGKGPYADTDSTNGPNLNILAYLLVGFISD